MVAKNTARKPSPRTPRSTLVPRAWPLRTLDERVSTTLARHEGVEPKALSEHLRDRSRVVARLRALDPVALVVLEAIAEAGGRLSEEQWLALACRRTGIPAGAIKESLAAAMPTSLVGVAWSGGAMAERRGHALIDPPGAAIAEALRGVTLPPAAPPADAEPRPANVALRDVVALAALTGHRRLRRTRYGNAPHRSDLKRFTRGLGVTAENAERLLVAAVKADVLGARGDCLSPRADHLRALARGERGSADPSIVPLHWIDGWVSAEALARARLRRELDRRDDHWALQLDIVKFLDVTASQICEHPALEVVSAGDAAWVRRRDASTWYGDGHVTPSFEVMLGPAASMELLAVIALGSELVRLDRVLTFRITRESVVAGLAAGLDGHTLLDALARVSRRDLPANVAILVQEWIDKAKVARLQRAWLLSVPADTADAIAEALGSQVIDRPSATVLAFSGDTPRKDVITALSVVPTGVAVAPISLAEAEAEYIEERWHDREPHPDRLAAPSPPPLPLQFAGDDALRARVDQARERGFAATEAPRSPPDATPTAMDTALQRLHRERLRELLQWSRKLKGRMRPEAEAAVRDAETMAPFLQLSRKTRRAVLARSRSIGDLLAASAQEGAFTGDALEPGHGVAGLSSLLGTLRGAFEAFSGANREPPFDAGGAFEPVEVLEQDPRAVRAALERACASQLLVHLRHRHHGQVHAVVAGAVARRGNEEVFLAIDPVSDEGHVFRLVDVLGVAIP
jgi:hypothetical protein